MKKEVLFGIHIFRKEPLFVLSPNIPYYGLGWPVIVCDSLL